VLAGATTLFTALACGGGSDPFSDAGTVDVGSDFTALAISALPDGGSGDWDTQVSILLIGAYDGDGSGSIDTADEINSIPCDTMKAMDKAVRDGWGSGIRTIYGFREGFSWVGSAIGLDESIRPQADAHFASCGVDES